MVYYFIVYFYIFLFSPIFFQKISAQWLQLPLDSLFWKHSSVDRDKHKSTKPLSFVNKVLPIAKEMTASEEMKEKLWVSLAEN